MQPAQLQAALAALAGQGLCRQRPVLAGPTGREIRLNDMDYLAFASNDYLGLANHPQLLTAARTGLDRWGLGSGASPLVAGHYQVHEQAEAALAAFVGQPSALLFSCGYMANQAVLTSLLGKGDWVFADRLNHASLNDGCRLSGARLQRFRHNDLNHLEHLLQTAGRGTRLIVVDTVYSMDGDQAPLADLLALAGRYDAWLYLDDAHGFGVLGEGRGALAVLGVQNERLVYMATLGKAAGVAGAFVAGSPQLTDWLLHTGRSYMFSTSPPPMLAEAVLVSLQLIATEGWRRERLARHIDRVQSFAGTSAWQWMPSTTPIQPLLVGDNHLAQSLSASLRALGVWIPAIRPPTVAVGTARLRISLSAAHEDHDIDRLLLALDAVATASESG